jgi:hypothetical protein
MELREGGECRWNSRACGCGLLSRIAGDREILKQVVSAANDVKTPREDHETTLVLALTGLVIGFAASREIKNHLKRNIKSMNYLLVRHKVADFSKWKPVYDAHLPAREKAGGTELYLLRSIDNPNEVIILFEIEDLKKAREFVVSDDLRQRMQESRVIDKPDIYFLTA